MCLDFRLRLLWIKNAVYQRNKYGHFLASMIKSNCLQIKTGLGLKPTHFDQPHPLKIHNPHPPPKKKKKTKNKKNKTKKTNKQKKTKKEQTTKQNGTNKKISNKFKIVHVCGFISYHISLNSTMFCSTILHLINASASVFESTVAVIVNRKPLATVIISNTCKYNCMKPRIIQIGSC